MTPISRSFLLVSCMDRYGVWESHRNLRDNHGRLGAIVHGATDELGFHSLEPGHDLVAAEVIEVSSLPGKIAFVAQYRSQRDHFLSDDMLDM